MADKSREKRTFHKEPLKHIGARDLLQVGFSYAGTIRKEGKIERGIGKKIPGSKKLTWRQYYVVLAHGCLYIYSDDCSKSPKKSFSLRQYDSVMPLSKEAASLKYCLRLLPMGESDVKPHCFACTDGSNRKTWIEHLEDEIMWACGQQSTKSSRLSKSKGQDKDESYEIDPMKSLRIEDTDESDGYDEINEKELEDNKQRRASGERYSPMPYVRKSAPNIRAVSKIPLTGMTEGKGPRKSASVAEQPKAATQTVQTPTYFNEKLTDDNDAAYENINRIEDIPIFEGTSILARRLLQNKDQGSFLIRPATQAPYALVVQTSAEQKQFHIHKSDEHVYLSPRLLFSSLSQLVAHFRCTELPNQPGLKLTTQITQDE